MCNGMFGNSRGISPARVWKRPAWGDKLKESNFKTRRKGGFHSFALFHKTPSRFDIMAKKPSDPSKSPEAPASVFESLLLVAVAATILAIVFLALSLSRYDWALPS
jgi:hypothetical protein